jgi:threonine/homoserine/homoserine lactone efflux protein
MTTFTKNHGDLFYGALAAVAIIGPILLVIAASAMPEGLEQGEFIVYGHGVVLTLLSIALVLRAAYVLGFSKALKIAAATESSYSVTA